MPSRIKKLGLATNLFYPTLTGKSSSMLTRVAFKPSYSSQAFNFVQTLTDDPRSDLQKTDPAVKQQRSHTVTCETLSKFYKMKKPITVLTAHDFASARMVGMSGSGKNEELSEGGVDICLCGDSLSMVSLGYNSTTELGLDEFTYHVQAVRRGLDSLKQESFYRMPLLLADLPFGSYEESVEQGVASVVQIIKRGRADAIKIEGGPELVPLVKRLTSFGIPIFGHIGLTPQRVSSLGGFKVQGHDSLLKARQIVSDALQLQEAGCIGLILEAVPIELVNQLTPQLKIPTIGIGAGPGTDGQVLVLTDLIGGLDQVKAKFVPHLTPSSSYNSGNPVYPVWELGIDLINQYVHRVRNRMFPEINCHTYRMKPQILQELKGSGW